MEIILVTGTLDSLSIRRGLDHTEQQLEYEVILCFSGISCISNCIYFLFLLITVPCVMKKLNIMFPTDL